MDARRRTSAAIAWAASLIVLASAAALPVACGPDGGDDPGAPAGGAGPQEPSSAPEPTAGPAPSPPERPAVRVSFKLDPRLTDGLYMGERWVSPPIFHAAAQTGSTFSVEAKVEGLAAGSAVTWTPSDPDAVAVAPPGAERVEITVTRAGRSTLTVAVGADASVLTIDAAQAGGVWRVTIAR
jgi:hypothetical protein